MNNLIRKEIRLEDVPAFMTTSILNGFRFVIRWDELFSFEQRTKFCCVFLLVLKNSLNVSSSPLTF